MPPLLPEVDPRPKNWPGEKEARRADGDCGVGGGEFPFVIMRRSILDRQADGQYELTTLQTPRRLGRI